MAARRDSMFIPPQRIERDADALLEEYGCHHTPITEPPIPIDELVELELQLELVYLDMSKLFPVADVHGAIWFSEKRIGIDQSLEPTENPNRRNRYRFTLAHEVGHWRLHRAHFRDDSTQKRLFDDGTRQPDVVCRSSEKNLPLEYQANSFAACLLMPRSMVLREWTKWRGGRDEPATFGEIRSLFEDKPPRSRYGGPITDKETLELAMREEFSRPLAEIFEVSAESMQIRLTQLELLVAVKNRRLF